MKFLIITASSATLQWDKLPTYLAEIKSALNSGEHADWTVDIVYQPVTPKMDGDRIDHTWLNTLFKPHFANGFDVIGLHFNMKQKLAWGVQPSLRGSNPRTDDEMGDFWFCADETSLRKGYPTFVQTCLHEFAHEYFFETKQPDVTHTFHDKQPDIKSLFTVFDWSLYQPKRQALKKKVSILTTLLKLLQKKQPLPLKDLQPLVKRASQGIIDDMAMLGHEVRTVEGYRSKERQEALYAQGRTAPGAIVTNARAGESLHNYGVAVDFVFRKEGYDASKELWETLGTVGEQNGFKWGGRWQEFIDRPHFELTLDYDLDDFKDNKIDWSRYA